MLDLLLACAVCGGRRRSAVPPAARGGAERRGAEHGLHPGGGRAAGQGAAVRSAGSMYAFHRLDARILTMSLRVKMPLRWILGYKK